MDIARCKVVIMRHALLRAYERGVTPDMVEATIRGGALKRFGKNCYKFIRRYKRFTVVCVDHLCDDEIRIVTVEIQ
jgi:hypothetical protein